ncbi:MAG: translation initiation factor IF-2, partial [Myxococcota bacterium]
MTEKVMTKDPNGRSKLVDSRELNKGRKPGRPRREEPSAREQLETRGNKVYYPTPSRKKPKGKKKHQGPREPTQPLVKQPVIIGDTITVAELSQQMSRKANELIMWLMRNGVMANINQPIDHDTATMMVEDLGYEVTSKVLDESAMFAAPSAEEAEEEKAGDPRAAVVTVMGHVDHGKTSLLDRIRNAKVAEGEAGGITQRIAGYQVETPKGLVTFLDTPGHAAFTSMRARGANVTDIVVLVVAADDGVMPQTREAIQHAQAADVPIIVAVNKVDKPEANPGRVLQQLTEHNIVVEEFGGDTLSQKISAKTGEGVDALLEQLGLQAEILELKAEQDVPGVGSVVEGHIHKGRGPVATILVQEGTLRKGDIIVVGESVGKVRAMIVDGGRQVKEAGPSTPVEILGLDSVPTPGDEVRVAKDMAAAKELAAHRREKRRAQELSGTAKVSLQDFLTRMSDASQKELKLVVKGDVQGSVEALSKALTDLTTAKVRVSVISSGVGAVNESDVEFAAASEAIVVGFAVRPDTKALKAARALGVDIRTYDIIYEAVDEVQAAMRGLLAPVAKEQYLGRAEVLQTFNVPKVGTVAGCKVVDGTMVRNANIRLLRDSKTVYDGKLASLKRFKDDVREVKEGFECGMGMEKFNDIKVGDIFEAYEIVMTEAALDEP